MAIQVRNSAELKRLVEAIVLELVDANIAFNMHMHLIESSVRDRGEAMRQRWTFWSLTIQGHLDSAILRLCKIYDQKKHYLGLRGFLDTIRCNQHLFDRERYVERGAVIANFEPLDTAQLEVDLAYVTREGNPTVDRLLKVRGNYYAHRNARDVVEDYAVSERYPHQRDEVGELLRGGLSIVNRYSSLFDGNIYASQIIGGSDYHYVLDAAQERLDRLRRERGM
jgi:hypothetical protein